MVVGIVDDVDSLDGVLGDRPDALAAPSSALAVSLCERVDVPVGVVVSPQRLSFAGRQIDSVGPFHGTAPHRFAQVSEAVIGGARVVVSTDVRSDRRVVEVLARILGARDDS